MMISEPYLDEIRARWEAVRGIAIEIASGPDGNAMVLARQGASQAELRVTRDGLENSGRMSPAEIAGFITQAGG
ncbi:MAG TPA: hypothetical protein VMV07_17190 [Streptosporangiaceae bacterium]|nr:hypothetical protein [Streptosporangiaceae bacterium]